MPPPRRLAAGRCGRRAGAGSQPSGTSSVAYASASYGRALGTSVARASAGADRHALVSSWVRGRAGRTAPGRVSSSSWRMIAAASRSTRAR